MAIKLDPLVPDAQGLPVVSWEEDRNLFAPDGIGRKRVSCFIRTDKEGVLQFVSVGSVRHGGYQEARPWEALRSFEITTAERLYYSPKSRALLDMVASKSKSGAGRILTTDGAYVLLANFDDDRPAVPMHLNCADCTPVEATDLHDRLHSQFISAKRTLVNRVCEGGFSWPENKPAFIAYEPPPESVVPRLIVRLADITVIAMLGLVGWGIYWLFRS